MLDPRTAWELARLLEGLPLVWHPDERFATTTRDVVMGWHLRRFRPYLVMPEYRAAVAAATFTAFAKMERGGV